jgi:hypothetical protein
VYWSHSRLTLQVWSQLVAIEVKQTSEDEINALSNAFNLVRSPDINAAIVVGPEGRVTEDMRALADQGGIGLDTINSETGRWTWVRGPRYSSPSFSQQWAYPREASAGQEFMITVTISNSGQKPLAAVRVGYVQAYPFAVPQGKANSVQVAEIVQGGCAPLRCPSWFGPAPTRVLSTSNQC